MSLSCFGRVMSSDCLPHQVYACKTDVFELLRTRLDAVQARLSGIKGG